MGFITSAARHLENVRCNQDGDFEWCHHLFILGEVVTRIGTIKTYLQFLRNHV